MPCAWQAAATDSTWSRTKPLMAAASWSFGARHAAELPAVRVGRVGPDGHAGTDRRPHGLDQHVTAAGVTARRDAGRRDDGEQRSVVAALLPHIRVQVDLDGHPPSLGFRRLEQPR